jgi:hypothetical protein
VFAGHGKRWKKMEKDGKRWKKMCFSTFFYGSGTCQFFTSFIAWMIEKKSASRCVWGMDWRLLIGRLGCHAIGFQSFQGFQGFQGFIGRKHEEAKTFSTSDLLSACDPGTLEKEQNFRKKQTSFLSAKNTKETKTVPLKFVVGRLPRRKTNKEKEADMFLSAKNANSEKVSARICCLVC